MNTHRNSRQQQSFQSEKKAVLNTKNQKSPYLFDEKYQEIDVFFNKLHENFPVIYANIRV